MVPVQDDARLTVANPSKCHTDHYTHILIVMYQDYTANTDHFEDGGHLVFVDSSPTPDPSRSVCSRCRCS